MTRGNEFGHQPLVHADVEPSAHEDIHIPQDGISTSDVVDRAVA